MASDGFVQMPGLPERWVRLVEGGFQIKIPFDGVVPCGASVHPRPRERNALCFGVRSGSWLRVTSGIPHLAEVLGPS